MDKVTVTAIKVERVVIGAELIVYHWTLELSDNTRITSGEDFDGRTNCFMSANAYALSVGFNV